jgi:hypothetical protein
VLVAGGEATPFDYLASADLYDPATDSWTPAAPMHAEHDALATVLLADGRVLAVGGYGPTAATGAEVFDPATGKWTAPRGLTTPRGEGNRMVTLTDGRPVVVGGYTEHGFRYEDTAEVYDAATDTWAETPPMAVGRADHVAVALPDDSVLVAGGFGAGTRAERMSFAAPTPTPTPTPTPAPTTAPAAPAPVPRPHSVARLTAARHLRATRAGSVTVLVRCRGTAVCHGRVLLRIRHGRTLARATLTVPAGGRRHVRLRLRAGDRRRLARHLAHVVVALAGQPGVSATLRVPRGRAARV